MRAGAPNAKRVGKELSSSSGREVGADDTIASIAPRRAAGAPGGGKEALSTLLTGVEMLAALATASFTTIASALPLASLLEVP